MQFAGRTVTTASASMLPAPIVANKTSEAVVDKVVAYNLKHSHLSPTATSNTLRAVDA